MPTTKVVRTTVVQRGTKRTFVYEIWPWAVFTACIALLFAIISIGSSGWNGRNLMKNCNNCLGTIVLAFFGIFSIILGIISIILFAKRLITSFSTKIKVSAVLLFAFAGIFIVAAYTTYITYSLNNYSYYLMAAAGIFTFISSIIAAFWLGRNWNTV